jgi:hypothetical protein
MTWRDQDASVTSAASLPSPSSLGSSSSSRFPSTGMFTRAVVDSSSDASDDSETKFQNRKSRLRNEIRQGTKSRSRSTNSISHSYSTGGNSSSYNHSSASPSVTAGYSQSQSIDPGDFVAIRRASYEGDVSNGNAAPSSGASGPMASADKRLNIYFDTAAGERLSSVSGSVSMLGYIKSRSIDQFTNSASSSSGYNSSSATTASAFYESQSISTDGQEYPSRNWQQADGEAPVVESLKAGQSPRTVRAASPNTLSKRSVEELLKRDPSRDDRDSSASSSQKLFPRRATVVRSIQSVQQTGGSPESRLPAPVPRLLTHSAFEVSSPSPAASTSPFPVYESPVRSIIDTLTVDVSMLPANSVPRFGETSRSASISSSDSASGSLESAGRSRGDELALGDVHSVSLIADDGVFSPGKTLPVMGINMQLSTSSSNHSTPNRLPSVKGIAMTEGDVLSPPSASGSLKAPPFAEMSPLLIKQSSSARTATSTNSSQKSRSSKSGKRGIPPSPHVPHPIGQTPIPPAISPCASLGRMYSPDGSVSDGSMSDARSTPSGPSSVAVSVDSYIYSSCSGSEDSGGISRTEHLTPTKAANEGSSPGSGLQRSHSNSSLSGIQRVPSNVNSSPRSPWIGKRASRTHSAVLDNMLATCVSTNPNKSSLNFLVVDGR